MQHHLDWVSVMTVGGERIALDPKTPIKLSAKCLFCCACSCQHLVAWWVQVLHSLEAAATARSLLYPAILYQTMDTTAQLVQGPTS